MEKKKIIVFIDWYLPGYKAGGPIQSVSNLVDHLKDEFDFYIVTRDTDYCESKPYPNIISNEWNTVADGVNVFYFSQNNLTRSNIRKLLRQTTFDSVYLNGIFSLYFTLLPLYYLRKHKNKKVVIAARGMLAESALGVKKMKKRFFLRAVKTLKLFDQVIFHASTENEKEDIRKALGNSMEIKIAGNLPQLSVATENTERIKTPGMLKLVNVARIAPEKNLLLALQILHQVKENVSFDFYGPVYNNEYWEECKAAMKTLPPNILINYKGSLESNKVLAELDKYHMLFMPTRGENFGHIILQSLSVGCPVIISDQTPWKNLKKENVGWDLSLDDLSAFSVAIDTAAQMNQQEYNNMSQSAFVFAKKYIDNPEIIKQNRHLFNV
jgi:glycosyltransferase involved in cell wall biosynthesis